VAVQSRVVPHGIPRLLCSVNLIGVADFRSLSTCGAGGSVARPAPGGRGKVRPTNFRGSFRECFRAPARRGGWPWGVHHFRHIRNGIDSSSRCSAFDLGVVEGCRFQESSGQGFDEGSATSIPRGPRRARFRRRYPRVSSRRRGTAFIGVRISWLMFSRGEMTSGGAPRDAFGEVARPSRITPSGGGLLGSFLADK